MKALDLTALVALRDQERVHRYAVRWLQRWLDETGTRTIDDATMIAACLGALGGHGHSARRWRFGTWPKGRLEG